jgi:hypothetical protein
MFTSSGVKRRLVAYLNALLEVARAFPELAPAVSVLEQAIGLLGGVALVHAAGGGTLSKYKLAGISSLLSVIISVGHFVPALTPFMPVLTKLAAFFGALSTGDTLAYERRRKDGD